MLDKSKKSNEQNDAVIIKKYANRRLYNTESSTYVTLEDLAQMVRSDRDFIVYDAKTGDDLTHAVLTQIIVEQESRADGPTLLPTPFLRQLIRYYDDSMSRMVPGYLQFSLESFSREQDHFRKKFADAWGGAGLEALQEQARHNLEVFEKAMTMWSPYRIAEAAAKNQASAAASTTPSTDQEDTSSAPTAKAKAADSVAKPDSQAPKAAAAPPAAAEKGSEIDALKSELEAMQRRIERLSQDDS
jgi:polyhydroxyalkanoate synthesis repressor PhaR